MKVKILLADDHRIMREGLRGLIEREPDLEVIAEADNGEDAVNVMMSMGPHVVIMDVEMPGLNGIDATQRIKHAAPGVKVIGLSMYADRRFVDGMLTAGASGYLLKDCAFEELAQSVRAVMAGKIYVSQHIAQAVVGDYVRRIASPSQPSAPALTARELEVLRLLAEGASTKRIAGNLGISVKTVETHRARIMEKLDLHSLAELTKYAIREGLTSVNG